MVQSSIQSASQVQTGPTAMLQDYNGTNITPSPDTMGRLLSILPQDPETVSTISSWDMSGKVSCLARVAGGGFSDVWKGTMSCDGQEIQMVAIKQLRITTPGELKSQERVVKRLFREVNTWRKLIHPNVVPLLGFSLNSDELPSLISPWYSKGNIVSYLRSNPITDRLPLVVDVSRGICYLHSQSLVHGDLKGENVLVDDNGSANLCDFGMSKFIDDAQRITGFTTSTSDSGGTMRFFAPELLSAASKTKETDMWALSCLILQIMTGEVPYNDAIIIAAVVGKILCGDPPYSVELVESLFSRSESVSGCLNKCWDMDPSLRPSARSLLDLIETPFVGMKVDEEPQEVTSEQGIIRSPLSQLLTPPSERVPTTDLKAAFFYGTLMDLERLTRILEHDGSDLVFSVGVIKGYTLHQVADANYPAIIHSIQSQARFGESRPKNDTVPGIIVKGLTPDDIKRVRDYNGSMYKFIGLRAHQLDKFQRVRRYSRPLEEITARSPEYWSRRAMTGSFGQVPVVCAVWQHSLDYLEPGTWRYEEMKFQGQTSSSDI